MDIKIEFTDEIITSHAGLASVGKCLNTIDFFAAINKVSRVKKNSGLISDYDIVKTMIGLITLGKPYYDAVEEYREDPYFKQALKLKKVPSSPILRQRLDEMPPEVMQVLTEFNQYLLQQVVDDEISEIEGDGYLIVDFDVSPMDNSNSKKEGVSLTYKLFEGYSPMFSYMGSSGFMLNNQLREGQSHSNCEGSLAHISQTIDMSLSLIDVPLLVRFDSGNDSLENVLMFEGKSRVKYLIKRNLRRENKSDWFELAKIHAQETVQIRQGLTKYYALHHREVEDGQAPGGKRQLTILIVATEETIDKKGQRQLLPEVSVETYWINLELPLRRIEQLYHEHATCEQYHSEFKTDLDMERLPSGKFKTNTLLMHLGMVAFNLLRLLGKDVLKTGRAPGRRGQRLRIRTVLQNIMYMGARFLEWTKRTYLRIYRRNKWAEAFYYAC